MTRNLVPTTLTLCGPDDLQRNVAVLPADARGVPQDLSHGTFGCDGIDHVVHDAHLDRALDPPRNHFVLRCELEFHLLP